MSSPSIRSEESGAPVTRQPALERKIGPVQATAINMTQCRARARALSRSGSRHWPVSGLRPAQRFSQPSVPPLMDGSYAPVRVARRYDDRVSPYYCSSESDVLLLTLLKCRGRKLLSLERRSFSQVAAGQARQR